MLPQAWMFEASFRRPSDYCELNAAVQWAIDKSLGILDWDGGGHEHPYKLSEEERKRFEAHYDYYKKKV
jgi:hypothetical protein